MMVEVVEEVAHDALLAEAPTYEAMAGSLTALGEGLGDGEQLRMGCTQTWDEVHRAASSQMDCDVGVKSAWSVGKVDAS
jgi:hypothetical protein